MVGGFLRPDLDSARNPAHRSAGSRRGVGRVGSPRNRRQRLHRLPLLRPFRRAGGLRLLHGADLAGRADSVHRGQAGRRSGAFCRRLAPVVHRAPHGRCPHHLVPALRLAADSPVVPHARCQDRQGRGDFHRGDDPQAHGHQGRCVPRRRHHDRRLRTRRRLDAHWRGQGGQALLRGQLRNHGPRPQAVEELTGCSALVDA